MAGVRADWMEWDEGLYNALRLRYTISIGRSLKEQVCDFPLSPGEVCYATFKYNATDYVYREARDVRYFRIKVKWARDPLMAPFLWLMFLPFNFLSWAIAKLIGREVSGAVFSRSGTMVLTSHGMRIYGPFRDWLVRYDSVVDVQFSSHTLRIILPRAVFLPDVGLASAPWVYVFLKFMAFNDIWPQLTLHSTDFVSRARANGREIPPEWLDVNLR